MDILAALKQEEAKPRQAVDRRSRSDCGARWREDWFATRPFRAISAKKTRWRRGLCLPPFARGYPRWRKNDGQKSSSGQAEG